MKYLLVCILASLTFSAMAENFEVCKFEGDMAEFKPVVECTVYNGLLTKHAHNLVVAMKACIGKNEKGEYLFNSVVEKSLWMKDRSIIDLNTPLSFTTIENKDKGISSKVEELTDKKSKKESVAIMVRKSLALEAKERTHLNLKLENKKIRSLELKIERRNPFSPIPTTSHHLSMGCQDLVGP